MMKTLWSVFIGSALLFSGIVSAQEKTPILDTSGFWRIYAVMTPPVLNLDEGPEKIILKQINNTKINDIITGSCYLGYYVRTVI